MLSRDELATQYLDQLPYPPYPVQEEALLAWFLSPEGVLVCAPTGTGKTLIAQAALYEALHTGTTAYYTSPLIALCEQKFFEMQAAAVNWGFSKDDVGLVTGNRKVNPGARVLVVVAEILLNRLLHPEGHSFADVSAVVMDEFHSFADPERGIVWELSLNLLPRHVRLLLLSATVGNAVEFLNWLERCHGRKLELVEGRERKIPLTYHWVGDEFLNDLLVSMAKGVDAERKTPALVFAFNREECWSIAEQLKGLDLVNPAQRTALNAAVDRLEWPQGIGPKLKQMLRRGVGVHHAGLLPKYRRIVEEFFERKLLSVAMCTETLAAGINLPARSVVVKSLVKGPFGKEKLIDPSTAHQIFGRAGRPQFDTEGHVFALPDEDDVRIINWKKQYDQIPEDTKDPGLLKAKKNLLRKKPTRHSTKKYWSEGDFEKLKSAPPARLYSKGPLPWRMLAYLLDVSPEVERIRSVIRKRLLDAPRIEAGMKQLTRMLLVLHHQGYLILGPAPSEELLPGFVPPPGAKPTLSLADYQPILATPTPSLANLLVFRAVHPLYGAFLMKLLALADVDERIQLFESVLELPKPLLKFVRVPYELPSGKLQTEMLDPELIARGLMAAKTPSDTNPDEEDEQWEERPPVLAEKARLLFDATHPDVTDVTTQAVWAAGEVLHFGGNFNAFISSKDLAKQEGLVFRHLLRLILLMEEFTELTPPGLNSEAWKSELNTIGAKLTETCRAVDPQSTEATIRQAHSVKQTESDPPGDVAFGEGILE